MRSSSKSGIYKIQCLQTEDCYIGSAVRLSIRLSNHRSDLNKGRHPNIHLLRAWRKYGEGEFVFVPLLHCDKEHLIFFEQRAIDILNPRYNIERHAASSLGRKPTPETLAKLSAAKKGRPLSTSHVAALMGHIISPETKAKIAAAHLGKPKPRHTPEQRAARSAWITGRRHTPESIAKMRESQRIRFASPTEPAGRAPTGQSFEK